MTYDKMRQDYERMREADKNRIVQMLEALEMAEMALSMSTDHNPWDLGPSKALRAVRAAIDAAKGQP